MTFVKGKGACLWDDKGKKYLDFFSGLAVCGLGHSDPVVAQAVSSQVKQLAHTSNIYSTKPQQLLAKELIKKTFPGKVFFSNSGAEANECAIKLARRYGHTTPVQGKPRYEIITFKNSFHGRTLGTLSATGQEKFHQGFGPLPVGFPTAEIGDIPSVLKCLNNRTCAILLESIQGEGGINPVGIGFLKQIKKICQAHKLLLILDEIQTGVGRTGTLFSFQNSAVAPAGFAPDILTTAKGLGNGIPVAATIAKASVADLMQPGDHGSTFGGGPVACQAALAVLQALSSKKLARIRVLGKLFQKEIMSWQKEMPEIQCVRGQGLMIGIDLNKPGKEVVSACLKDGLLVNCTAETVVRLLPPYCLTDQQVKSGLKILKKNISSK